MSKPLLQNIFVLRRPRAVNFVGIVKIAIMFIKTTLKYSIKVKNIRNYV